MVLTGAKGVTDAVHKEIEKALEAHELIKIKLMVSKDERKTSIAAICEQHQAEEIQSIGNMLTIYRKRLSD